MNGRRVRFLLRTFRPVFQIDLAPWFHLTLSTKTEGPPRRQEEVGKQRRKWEKPPFYFILDVLDWCMYFIQYTSLHIQYIKYVYIYSIIILQLSVEPCFEDMTPHIKNSFFSLEMVQDVFIPNIFWNDGSDCANKLSTTNQATSETTCQKYLPLKTHKMSQVCKYTETVPTTHSTQQKIFKNHPLMTQLIIFPFTVVHLWRVRFKPWE